MDGLVAYEEASSKEHISSVVHNTIDSAEVRLTPVPLCIGHQGRSSGPPVGYDISSEHVVSPTKLTGLCSSLKHRQAIVFGGWKGNHEPQFEEDGATYLRSGKLELKIFGRVLQMLVLESTYRAPIARLSRVHRCAIPPRRVSAHCACTARHTRLPRLFMHEQIHTIAESNDIVDSRSGYSAKRT